MPIDHGWGVEKWGQAKWGVVLRKQSAADALVLADALSKRPRPRIAETILSLADGIRNQAKLAKADALVLANALRVSVGVLRDDAAGLLVSISPRSLVLFADAVGLADSLLVLDQALSGDAVDMPDLLQSLVRLRPGDQLAVSDATSAAARLSLGDSASVADMIAAAVAAYRIDQITLADEIAAGTGLQRDDMLALLDGIAAAVARDAEDEALALADDLVNLVILGVNEYSGVLDGLAVALGTSLEGDSSGLADRLVRRMGRFVADLLDTLDGIRAAAGSSLADAGETTDGLRITIKRTVGDLLGLTDDIRSAMQAYRPIPARWGQGVWGSSVFGGSTGDPLGVTDQVSIARGVALLAQDVADIADELRARARLQSVDQAIIADSASARPQTRSGDMVAAADDLASQARSQATDLLSATDELLRAVAGVMSADALLGTDSLVRLAIGALVGELLAAGDDSRAVMASLVADVMALDDAALLRIGQVVADAAALVDAIIARAGLLVLDDAPLVEALAFLASLGARDDAATMADAVMAAITVRRDAAEGAVLLDDLRMSAGAVLADMLAPADLITSQASIGAMDSAALLDAVVAAARPHVAELLGFTDQQLQAVVRAVQAGAIDLVEQLAAYTGSSPAEAQPVADALVAALRMARQVDDLLASIDATRAAVAKLFPDDVELTDQTVLSIRAAQAEAASLAELLGLAAGRQLPDDMVGIIDEGRLRAVMGLDPDRFGVLDRVRGRVLRVLQQVLIQGMQVPVSGLRVHHSASERVGTCSFGIPNPSPEVLALARQRAEVRVYLLDGDGTDFFSGRIVGNPVRARGAITTELQITVDDWTAAAQDIFVQEVYTSASGTLDQLVRHMWSKYFGKPIRLDQVAATDRRIDLYRINYDSLFEATEQLAQLLGWVWFVDWDGADLILRFFPPSSAVSPVTLSRVNRNVVANTARFGQDEQIKNSIYVFGGDGRSAPYAERLVADGEKTVYRLSYKPHRPADQESGIVVLVGGIAQTVGIQGLHNVVDYDVMVNYQDQQLAWRDDNKPSQGAVIEAHYSYAYPILVHLTDDQSIATFGLSEAVVTDSKISDVRTAREVGRAQLRQSAWPRGYGSCEVLVPGLRAGQFVTVDMPAYGTQGLYEILEMEKWIEGATVRRRVTLNVADSPEARIAERLREFSRRLASLESSQRSDDIAVQRILRDPANLAVSVIATAAGQIYDLEQDDAEMGEVTAVTWKTAGMARVYASSQRILLRDASTAEMGPKNNSIGQVHEGVRGGISFWGRTRWGEKPWGVSVS